MTVYEVSPVMYAYENREVNWRLVFLQEEGEAEKDIWIFFPLSSTRS